MLKPALITIAAIAILIGGTTYIFSSIIVDTAKENNKQVISK